MSPPAASRLEALGFAPVFDYVEGKAGWGSAGLPLDGRNGSDRRAGQHVRRDVPSCRIGDSLQEVSRRAHASGWETCFVVDEQRTLLGRLGRAALARDDDVPVEQAMTEGPSTIRPSARLDAVVARMRSQKLSQLPVTTLDGTLTGVLRREDAEAALAQLGAAAAR